MAVDVPRRENKHVWQRVWRMTEHNVRQNCVMHKCSSQRQSSSHYYRHATKDGRMLFTQSRVGNNSLCITTALVCEKFVCDGFLNNSGKNIEKITWELHSTSFSDGWEWFERIITEDESWIHFYEPERKLASMVWRKKRKKHEEHSRMSGLPGRWC